MSKRIDKHTKQLSQNIMNIPKPYEYYYPVAENEWGVENKKTFSNATEASPKLFQVICEGVPKGILPAALGADGKGTTQFFELQGNNILVAGQTRSGKTTWLNSLIVSLCHFTHPKYMRLVIFDPKLAGFKAYKPVANVATDYKEICALLARLENELVQRMGYTSRDGNPTDIVTHNELVFRAQITKLLPYIVIIFDEFADFIYQAEKENDQTVIKKINRLVSLGLGLGIHLVFATQAPYRKYIDGSIKNNFGTRIAFKLGDFEQERITLGAKFSDEEPSTQRLEKGEFLIRDGGRKLFKGVLTTPVCAANAVKNWQRNGLSWKLF